MWLIRAFIRKCWRARGNAAPATHNRHPQSPPTITRSGPGATSGRAPVNKSGSPRVKNVPKYLNALAMFCIALRKHDCSAA